MRALLVAAAVSALTLTACPDDVVDGAGEGEGEGDAAEGEGEGEGEGDAGEGEGEGEGEGDGEGEGEGEGEPPALSPTYDDVHTKSAHNAYQRFEALLDMFVYHDIRSIELDIFRTKSGFTTTPGEWFVYHDDNDTETSCHRFSDCLGEVTSFARAAPAHEVITLFIDLKQAFAAGHDRDDLDALLSSSLSSLYGPADLLARCPGATTLRDAVDGTACTWPTLEELRGRVLVVLTGGRACGLGGSLDTYVGNDDGASRAAFVAPQLDSTCPLTSYDARPGVVFFNLDFPDRGFADDVRAAGLVSRVFNVNDQNAWDQSIDAQVHVVATDQVNLHEDPGLITHAPNGFPFTCFAAGSDPAACAAALAGGADVDAIGIEVDSDDIEGTGDDFLFVHDDLAPAVSPGGTLQALISTENSHVEEFAKACLMARASLDDDSAYVAVCRCADNQALRLQARTSAGASTAVAAGNVAPDDTVDEPNVAWARLAIDDDGLCATAFGSVDGVDFVQIGQPACANAPLTLQGLAASSHTGGRVRFVFAAPTRDGAPLPLPSATSAIGTVRASDVFAGVLP